MTDDLVKRLRETRLFYKGDYSTEAADRIEALTAENKALKQERDKLAEFVNWLIEEHDLEYQGVVANDA